MKVPVVVVVARCVVCAFRLVGGVRAGGAGCVCAFEVVGVCLAPVSPPVSFIARVVGWAATDDNSPVK